ncbi:MAG: ankyrin repeat domain-containing protein [Legionella longbeachae]|nr:ankyrin repeat domain-containing protein [Legionella longbeachae]
MNIIIDPEDKEFFTNPPYEDQRRILKIFLQSNAIIFAGGKFEKDKEYTTEKGDSIIFKCNVYKREKVTGDRFEFVSEEISKLIGIGGFGKVYENIARIALKKDNPIDELEYKKYGEKYLSKKIETLRTKPFRVTKIPMSNKTENPRFMKKIGDYDLAALNYNFQHSSQGSYSKRLRINLSPYEKRALSLDLLEEYSKEFLEQDLIHRDIKPDNIRISVLDDGLKGHFIDRDNVVKINSNITYWLDSHQATPPEAKTHTQKIAQTSADIYSLGTVLQSLWKEELDSLTKHIEYEKIRNLINNMKVENADERISLPKAIKIVKNLNIHKAELTEFEKMRQFLNAVKFGKMKQIDAWLDKININAQDASGYTALYFAVTRGKVEIVKKLLDAGADPNICPYGTMFDESCLFNILFPTAWNDFPMDIVPQKDAINIAKLLIKKGAKIKLPSGLGYSDIDDKLMDMKRTNLYMLHPEIVKNIFESKQMTAMFLESKKVSVNSFFKCFNPFEKSTGSITLDNFILNLHSQCAIKENDNDQVIENKFNSLRASLKKNDLSKKDMTILKRLTTEFRKYKIHLLHPYHSQEKNKYKNYMLINKFKLKNKKRDTANILLPLLYKMSNFGDLVQLERTIELIKSFAKNKSEEDKINFMDTESLIKI